MMQVALAQTGVWLSDGATNIMPVAAHAAAGRPITDASGGRTRPCTARGRRISTT